MTSTLTSTAFDQFLRAQPAAAAALRTAVATKSVAHAWLLLGPAGGGQVEAAKYLGAALNCASGQAETEGIPCGTCPSCLRVIAGTHTAVRDFHPEGSSHRVDDVRDEWIPVATRSSLDGKWKVLRIVAADRMNETAQNAFLKILEEPPASTIWILDVADDAALLDTIISRCRRLDVTPWSQTLLRERLDLWVNAGEGDPGIGSGAEVIPPPPVGRVSKKKVVQASHLDSPGSVERTAIVRLAKGSPQMLSTLSACDGRRVREVAVTTVDTIIELGPKSAGGAAPSIANRVLEVIVESQQRIATHADDELRELGQSLGVLDDDGKAIKGTKFPPGVEKRIKSRSEREQREVATSTCRLYLDLVATYLQDVLVAWQAQGGAVSDDAIRNVDRKSSIKRAGDRMDPVGIVEALHGIELAHLALDLNGERKLQLERAIVRIVLACARG